MSVAIHTQAYNNSQYCGDVAGNWCCDSRVVLCMADGLGHGKEAWQAARAAVHYIGEHLHEPIPHLFRGCDRAIRGTRGAALGVAVIDTELQRLSFAGVNNTRALVIGCEQSTYLTSCNGIIGANYQPLIEESMALEPGSLVLLYTDGLPEILDLSCYRYRLNGNLQTLAELLVKDFNSGDDDAGMLIYRVDFSS